LLREAWVAWGYAIELGYTAVMPPIVPIPIRQPVFILGMERSGTTLIYSLLANHPAFYWLSTLDTVLPRSPAVTSVFRRSVERVAAAETYLSVPGTIAESAGTIAPSECGRYWRMFVPDAGPVRQDGVLRAEDVPRGLADRLMHDLGVRLALMDRQRLLAKRPGFALKIPYLRELFPDAIFVDVVRRAEDNVRSLVAAKRRSTDEFWGIKVPGWQDLAHRPLQAQAEAQLAAVRAIVERDARGVPAGQYVQVSYDELVESPSQAVRSMLERLSLEPTARMLAASAMVVRPPRRKLLDGDHAR
jgi:Sulfotransferase family